MTHRLDRPDKRLVGAIERPVEPQHVKHGEREALDKRGRHLADGADSLAVGAVEQPQRKNGKGGLAVAQAEPKQVRCRAELEKAETA